VHVVAPLISGMPIQSPPLFLRRATIGDAAMLAALAAKLFEQAFGTANDPENMRAYLEAAFSEAAQRAELADPTRAAWLLTDTSGRAVGYAMLRQDSRAKSVVAASPAELQRIYVDEAWHGRGAAVMLMKQSIEQARAWGCDVLWLGVWQENPRAITFYKRSGFTIVGTQTFTLGRDVQHDFVMALAVP
jgi:diamine N-acetyltransferase